MVIHLIGILDSEREEVFAEITANGFEWDYAVVGLEVSGSNYCIESFTKWLDSMDILWCEI